MHTPTMNIPVALTLIALALSTPACPSSEDSNDADTTQVCLPTSGDEACGEAYSDKNGVYKDRLVVGTSLPLTGQESGLGLMTRDGIEAYFAHINRTGGVHGRKLELIAMDDSNEPARAKENVEEMIAGPNRKVFALLGNVGEVTMPATVYLANEHQVNLFAPVTGGSTTRNDPPDYVIFNYRASYYQETSMLASYLLNVHEPAIAKENVMMFSQADGRSTKTDWTRLDEHGLPGFLGLANVLRRDEFFREDIFLASYAHNTTSVDGAVEETLRWMASDERAWHDGRVQIGIVLHATPEPGASFIKQLRDMLTDAQTENPLPIQLSSDELAQLKKVQLQIVSTSAAGHKLSSNLKQLQTLTQKYCEGIKMTHVIPTPTSGAKLVQEYREHLGAYDPNLVPTFENLEGYISARLFVEALKRAGKALNDLHLSSTINQLGELEIGLGVALVFNETEHQASRKVWGFALDGDCAVVNHDLE